MNIYDFDNTIFRGDSSVKFIKYSFKKHPLLVIKCLPKTLKESFKYPFKKSDLGFIKSELFSFVKDIDDLDNYINNFILLNMKNIKKFYLEGKKENDTVISASFDFLIEPFCKKLGIKNVIATKYDIKKGKIIGKNCKGNEKVIRFKKIFPKELVRKAYSDSLSDIPMLELAEEAFLVKDEEIIPYKK